MMRDLSLELKGVMMVDVAHLTTLYEFLQPLKFSFQ